MPTSGSLGQEPWERLLRLRQFSGGGVRAPHKPLLVLLALAAKVEAGDSRVEWEFARDRLYDLLRDYGPPPGPRPDSPAYPFTRLRNDKVWVLSRAVNDDAFGALNAAPAYGRFAPDIEAALTNDPVAALEIARRLVGMHFPPSMHVDVLTACGLDADAVLDEGSRAAPRVVTEVVSLEQKRSAAWKRDVLKAWDSSCGFCGFDGRIGSGVVGVEAAHIRWHALLGPNHVSNGLALCSLHHALFDRGVLTVTESHVIVVSTWFSAASSAGRSVYALHGRELSPRPGTVLDPVHLEWHRRQVFKGDPLPA